MVFTLIASIPSPPFNQIGPFRLYGLCIALGVIAAVMISSRRWEERGGSADDIASIAMWAVPAGVIGARLYHVATDWNTLYADHPLDAFKITRGGLGIPGGIFLGTLVGLLVVRAKGLPKLDLLDVAAPAIPVAQAIGRFGNYFNQEVFGRPTKLPWGLRIDEQFRPAGDAAFTTYHPTFIYEGLWNLALAFILIRLDKQKKLRPGQLFTLYVLGYAVGRLWVEMLRSDPATLVFGIRINIWMSIIVGLIALAFFLRSAMRPAPTPAVVGSDSATGVDGGDSVASGGGEAGSSDGDASTDGADDDGEGSGTAAGDDIDEQTSDGPDRSTRTEGQA